MSIRSSLLARFALVSDALALIGFGFADITDLGGELAHLLFVATLHQDVGLVGAGDRQVAGNLALQLVGEADSQLRHLGGNSRRVCRTAVHFVNLVRQSVTLSHRGSSRNQRGTNRA